MEVICTGANRIHHSQAKKKYLYKWTQLDASEGLQDVRGQKLSQGEGEVDSGPMGFWAFLKEQNVNMPQLKT